MTAAIPPLPPADDTGRHRPETVGRAAVTVQQIRERVTR